MITSNTDLPVEKKWNKYKYYVSYRKKCQIVVNLLLSSHRVTCIVFCYFAVYSCWFFFRLGSVHLKCIEFLIERFKQIQFHLKFDIAKTLEEYYIALHFK